MIFYMVTDSTYLAVGVERLGDDVHEILGFCLEFMTLRVAAQMEGIVELSEIQSFTNFFFSKTTPVPGFLFDKILDLLFQKKSLKKMKGEIITFSAEVEFAGPTCTDLRRLRAESESNSSGDAAGRGCGPPDSGLTASSGLK